MILSQYLSLGPDTYFLIMEGSILGPQLFLIYVDNLEHGLYRTKVKLYADDTYLL